MQKDKKEKQELCPYDKLACEKMTRRVRDYAAKGNVPGRLVKQCDNRHHCERYKKHEDGRKVISIMSGLMNGKSGCVCPYNVQIDCGLFYRCDEFFRQNPKHNLANEEPVCAPDVCAARPEICPRFISFAEKQR